MQNPLFYLQMAGPSGVGKSTLARAFAAEAGAVVVDYDIVKSVALNAGAEWEMSGRIGYEASRTVAASLLEQGVSVILDSPCRFEQIVERGREIAAEGNAIFAFIECMLADETEHRRRMETRVRQRSQRVAFDIPPPDAPFDAMATDSGTIEIPKTIYPPSAWIRIDTSQPLERCVIQATTYLEELCNRV